MPDSIRAGILTIETPQSVIERASLYYVAVCELDTRIVGIAGLDLNEVRILAVSPEHRRAGIGRSLIEHLKAMLPAAFFSDMFVYASSAAVQFYKSCAFVDRGTVELDTGHGKMPAVFMALPIKRI